MAAHPDPTNGPEGWPGRVPPTPKMGVRGVIKVQLIDDHIVVRAGVRRLLEAEKGIRVVAESASVAEGVRDCAAHHPDVVILEVVLPDGDGLHAAERLRDADPDARVIVLTLVNSGVFPLRALKGGAKGYLSKACRPEDLVRAVRAVAAGEVYLEPKVAQALALRPFSGEPDPVEALTDREFEVFRMLAQGQSVRSIAERLCLSPKTVGACRTRIMKALSADNLANLALMAVRQGLITV
jgi:two-component system invasion response regulator UvrY